MSGQRKHTICSPGRSPFLHLEPERCCQHRGMVEDERYCRRTGEDEGWIWAWEVKMYGREGESNQSKLKGTFLYLGDDACCNYPNVCTVCMYCMW